MSKTILATAAIAGLVVASWAAGPVVRARSSAGIADTREVAFRPAASMRVVDTRHPVKGLSSPGGMDTAMPLGLSVILR